MVKKEFKDLNIHQKLLKISDGAGILQKNKGGYQYKYVTEEEIQAKVTALMQKYGVMLYHKIVPGTKEVTRYTYSKLDKKSGKAKEVTEYVVTADTVYTWVNTDNPDEKIEIPWILIGSMEDASQAFGAAETYCNRYFFMKSLQLATSEADPDAYRTKQLEAENYMDSVDLNALIKEVVTKGATLISNGVPKDKMLAVVSSKNSGNENPNTIKNPEICEAILEEFDKLLEKNNKAKKGENK